MDRLVATPGSDLISLGFDMVVEHGSLTAMDLAARAGVSIEELVVLYRTLGIDIDDPDVQVFEEAEVQLVELLSAIAQAFQGPASSEVLRAIDDGLSTMASASIAAFVGTVEADLAEAGDELEWARGVTTVGELGLEVAGGLRPLFRHHLRRAIAHQRESMRRVDQRQLSELSVGFVDLVGYTSITAEMDVETLVEFTNRFRSRAHEVVGAEGGRVVKHIGDEIMFSSLDAGRACRIGLELVRSFGEEGSRPRGGVAYGPLLARYGDLYGPLVNLASRLADAAVPGELLAPAGIAADIPAGSGVSLEPAGLRQLKGFADPVAVVSVEGHDAEAG